MNVEKSSQVERFQNRIHLVWFGSSSSEMHLRLACHRWQYSTSICLGSKSGCHTGPLSPSIHISKLVSNQLGNMNWETQGRQWLAPLSTTCDSFAVSDTRSQSTHVMHLFELLLFHVWIIAMACLVVLQLSFWTSSLECFVRRPD
mgnify:CR=1 FL=1